MRTFLINLDCDSDRLAAVRDRMDKAGISFERVPAVYGKDLPTDEKERAIRRLRFRLSMGRGVFDGEIGCALSHAKVYQKMIAEKIPVACIFEDDVVLKNNAKAVLDEVERFVDCNKSQVVLLSDQMRNDKGNPGIVQISDGMATEAYVLTLPAARALLKCVVPMRSACDRWWRWVRLGAVALYGAFPAVADQAWGVFESHVGPSQTKARPFYVRIASGLGKLADRIMLECERLVHV